VLARGSDAAWHCYEEECYLLALEGDVVTLDYTSSAGRLAICSGRTSRDVRRGWRLVDGRAAESRPTPREPFAFVSDWIDAPWRDARLWAAHARGMRLWHRRLGELGCALERGRQWVDDCEATGSEVLELVLLGPAVEGEPEEDPPPSLFFLFDANAATLRLLDVLPSLPAGTWQRVKGCAAGPSS
jgi:hypothetical protein